MNPQLKDAYQRVVMAGMKALYSPQTRKTLMEGLSRKGDPAIIVAQEVAGLVKMLDGKANMKIPKEVIIPAAVTLMLDLFKFMEEAGKLKPDEEMVKRGMAVLTEILFREYQQMESMMQQGQQQPQQPAMQPPQQPMPQQPMQRPAGLMGA